MNTKHNFERQLELKRQFEEAAAMQREHSPHIREYEAANLPLLAEWRKNECKRLGQIMCNAIDELRQLEHR